MSNGGQRRPVNALSVITSAMVRNSSMFAQAMIDKADSETQWGLGIGRVVEIDYEELFCTLQILVGASGDAERVPIPLTFPGAGHRRITSYNVCYTKLLRWSSAGIRSGRRDLVAGITAWLPGHI